MKPTGVTHIICGVTRPGVGLLAGNKTGAYAPACVISPLLGFNHLPKFLFHRNPFNRVANLYHVNVWDCNS